MSILTKVFDVFKENGIFWTSLPTQITSFYRLIKAIIKGQYKGYSGQAMLYLSLGFIYFINPFDIVPDFWMWVGFMDDFTVFSILTGTILNETKKFRAWENGEEVETEPISDKG